MNITLSRFLIATGTFSIAVIIPPMSAWAFYQHQPFRDRVILKEVHPHHYHDKQLSMHMKGNHHVMHRYKNTIGRKDNGSYVLPQYRGQTVTHMPPYYLPPSTHGYVIHRSPTPMRGYYYSVHPPVFGYSIHLQSRY